MLIKRISLLCISVLFLLCFSPKIRALTPNDVSAKAAILYSPDMENVIFAKNEHSRLSMASTTKIMTALLAIEEATPDLNIIVSEPMLKVEGSSMGLLAGDSVSLRALVYGMMLESGNDAANVTALVLGDSIQGFADLMNQKAKDLGMNNTSFVTPSGLDAQEHYSTAYDMAILASSAIKNPEFAAICSQKTAKVEYGNPPYLRTLSNHNRLLHSYSGCFGIKTGFTKKSGRCLVSAAKRDGITLVAVTLNAPNDWSDHQKLYDYGFSQLKSYSLPIKQNISLPVVNGASKNINLKYAYEPKALYIDEPQNIETQIYIKAFEYAPICKNQVLGNIVYKSGEKTIADIPLLADEDICALEITKTPKISLKDNIINNIKNFFKFKN